MICSHCHDTGSLSKDPEGYLDCVRCDVAEERTKVEAWARGQLPSAPGARTWVWAIYQHGKAAAAALNK